MLIYLQMIESEEDKDKFEQLYISYKGFMYQIAYENVRHHEDAEDLVHQTFILLIKNLDKIGDIDSRDTKAYIAIVCEHCVINFQRRRDKYTELPLEVLDEIQLAYFPSEDDIRAAVLQLPMRYRDMIFLYYYYGYSAKEIAKRLDVTGDSVRKTMQRARKALWKIINEDGEQL